MENRTVRFAVDDNVNFYKIELSRTLLHFTEFDFTYFWEQCIDAGKTARKTGRLPQQTVSNAKTVICRAHPYIEACIGTDFSDIVTDCIIEYICHSERIGLEELWARCISPKNLYESAIFKRISEYKTNRAMNRWTSIVRIREYAANKMEYIFGGDGNTALTYETVRTRKEYFDLMLSVAANELGCPSEAMPSIKLCTPATLPNAAFAVGKVAKAIYRRFSDDLAEGRDMSYLEKRDCSKIRDQIAMEAYSYVKKAERPNEIEMNFALESIRENPAQIYLPDSLKAAIDLEFELMVKNNIFLRKCESCGRFFAPDDDNTRCDRINSSGKTCRQQYEELVESITTEALASSPAEARPAAESPEISPAAETPEILPPPQPKREPVQIPPETEKRSQKLYNALYKRVGKGIDENEFREWSQYLSNMKKNLKIGEAALDQLDDFLDYSDRLCTEVKLASKNKTVHAPVEKTYEHKERKAVPEAEEAEKAEPEEISENEFVEIAKLSEKIEKAESEKHLNDPRVPQVEAAVIPSDGVKVKPFVPQAFDSVYDAMMAGETEEEEEAPEKHEKKDVEIKKPQWERISREDAYGKKE